MTGPTPTRRYDDAMTALLNAADTAARLPWRVLIDEIAALLRDPTVVVPPRLVQPLPGGGSLFVMPAHDAQVAITKLITFTPANAAAGRPTIQGEVVVFDSRRVYVDARSGRTVALVGVEDLCVVDTPDAVLVTRAGHSQDVKHVVEPLGAHGKKELL